MRAKLFVVLAATIPLLSCQAVEQKISINESGLPVIKCDDTDLRVITDPVDAKHIGFAFLQSIRHSYDRNSQNAPMTEADWDKDFDARLDGCVWRIIQKPEPPQRYSRFIMSIDAADGRFLGILISD
jgi:hypothetical protein